MRKNKIAKWIERGMFSKNVKDTNALIQEAGDLLDSACSHEIIGGGILFKGKDGKYYTATVEVVIGKASKGFVKDALAEMKKA
jgi:hypothetical protein